CYFFFSSRRRHTRSKRDWSSDVCSSDLVARTIRSLQLSQDGPTTGDLRACAEAAEAAITELGGAQPGDKTMIDALHPAVEAFRRSEERRVGKEGREGRGREDERERRRGR